MNRSRGRGNRSLWPLIAVFVVLAAITVAAGYMGGQYLIRGVLGGGPETPPVSQEPQTEAGDTETVQLTGEKITLHRVQVGAFSEQANAISTVQKMQQAGYPAVALPAEEQTVNRVVVGVTESRELGKDLVQQLRADGVESLVAEWEVPSFTAEVQGPPDAMLSLQNLLAASEELISAKARGGTVLRPLDGEDASEVAVLVSDIRQEWEMTNDYSDQLPAEIVQFISEYLVPHLDEADYELDSASCKESYFRLVWAMISMRRAIHSGG